jgi:4-hydroxy-4-methyl-2-oxoglutarate aldolase
VADLLAHLGPLPVAVVADVLDALGHRDQVMAPRVRPLFDGARLAGRARTVRVAPADVVPERREDRYRLQLEAIERLGPGDVLVTSRVDACFWGELLSTASRAKGSPGIVVDGWVRDVEAVVAMGFATFCTGVHAADALGRCEVVELGATIASGDVAVDDGDVVLGGRDGVVVVPAGVAGEAIAAAEEKLRGEGVVRARLEEGMPVTDAFLTYGIL